MIIARQIARKGIDKRKRNAGKSESVLKCKPDKSRRKYKGKSNKIKSKWKEQR